MNVTDEDREIVKDAARTVDEHGEALNAMAALADYWYHKGYREGFDRRKGSDKVDRWMGITISWIITVLICLYIGKVYLP